MASTVAHGDVIVFWDPEQGPVPAGAVQRFAQSRDDAWTAGHALTTLDADDLFKFVEPLGAYRRLPNPIDGAVNWRLDPRATFVKGRALRELGVPSALFSTPAGAMFELGYRWLRLGGVMRQYAITPHPLALELELADRYLALLLHHSPKWAGYALARRISTASTSASAELVAWRAAVAKARTHEPSRTIPTDRDLRELPLPARPRVSVVLPTFGRYRYVAEVLEDVRAQTVAVSQVLVADGNLGVDRRPETYEAFRDLPLQVLWIEIPGTCESRNACLAAATGDYVWFIDDDSRLAPDNLENHLRVLGAYGADVSVGPAYTRDRPDLHPNQRHVQCTFMDCGTTLARREMIDAVGGFDMQFNDRLAGEDGELGLRFVRAGGLVVSNPYAKRFHYLAPVGGARASNNNLHRWKRWTLRPRPVQSLYYIGARHFDRSATLEAVLQAWLFVGWRRADNVKASRAWRLRNLAAELAAAPLSVLRLLRSVAIGRRMARQGPMIPKFEGAP